MAQDKKARPGPSRINVVGIGASAGGIEALREFFGALPDDLGLAYVVIVHLAPDHESELASILSRRTKMPVVEITEKSLELTRNSVYVIPPDRRLELRDGTIRATANFVVYRFRRNAATREYVGRYIYRLKREGAELRIAARRIQQCTSAGFSLSISAASRRQRTSPSRASSTSAPSRTPAASSRAWLIEARGITATWSIPARCRLSIMSAE